MQLEDRSAGWIIKNIDKRFYLKSLISKKQEDISEGSKFRIGDRKKANIINW